MSADESGARDVEAILRERLARCPELRPFLGRLCDYWDREGTPPSRLALDADLTLRGGALSELHAVFGAAALRSSRSGTPAALDVAAFLRGQDEAAIASWRAMLCRTLDRPPRDRAAERLRTSHDFDALLVAWRQAFPLVAGAAAVIVARAELWKRRLQEGSTESVRAQWWPWGQALQFLASRPEPLGLADLGARFYGSSKALRSGEARRFLASGLATLDDIDEDQVEPIDILRRFGVCDNPTALKVTVFGPLRLRKRGCWFDWLEQLHGVGEAAVLSLGNLAGVEAVELPARLPVVHTCENETPFCRLVRERFPGVLVYTEGYPNTAVRRLLDLLPAGVELRHWGDSDLDGLRIAALLVQERRLQLWRCGRPDLERQRERLVPLTAEQRQRARHWLQAHPEFRFRAELEFTLEHGWLEQESWQQA